jgi:hypothetical protein
LAAKVTATVGATTVMMARMAKMVAVMVKMT